jgi:hypothetical protein
VTELPTLDRPSAFRFSRPLGVFVRPGPTGLVSCRIRSWGSPFRAFSSRAAVRRLRRRCPLVVGMTLRRARATVGRSDTEVPPRIRRRPIWTWRRDAPRLQGFAPHESPPLRLGCLGRSAARGSLGIPPLQGVPPHRTGAAFTAPPLMRLPRGRERPFGSSTGCCYPARLAGLLRDCRPSWGFATS